MRIKKILFFTLTIIISINAVSQSFIAPEIQDKYHPSVYSRVYEITLITLIPHEKQVEFAIFFQRKDSLLIEAAKQEKSIKYCKELLDSLQIVFNKLFNGQQSFRYNLFKYQNYFEADAKMDASFIKDKFKTEEDIETSIYKLGLIKNQRVLKALLSNSSITNMPDSNKLFYQKHDSIISKYIITAQGESYFKNKISELEKIKQLSEKDKLELRKNYQNFCLKNGNNFHKNFNAAMQFTVSDAAYYKLLYQDSIDNIARLISNADIESYVYKYNLDALSKSKIAPILLDKANRTVWLETRYMFNRKRDSLQTEVNEISWAKIKKELIRIGYTSLGRSRFIDAIKYKRILQVSEIQIDSLVEENLRLDLLNYQFAAENNGAVADYSVYTSFMLRKVLNEGQYDTLLQLVVTPQALASAKQNWQELMKYKLTVGLDSAIAIKPIISYHLKRLIIWERYNADYKTYDKLMSVNRQNKPEILKRLDALKREDETETDKIKLTW